MRVRCGYSETYMHHLRVTLAVGSIEKMEHILLELLAVPIDIIPCL